MLKFQFKSGLMTVFLFMLSSACGDQKPGGETLAPIQLENLPIPSLNDDKGIHPSRAILEDTQNPFKSAVAGDDVKWPITGWADAQLSSRVVAKFYYWATNLAQGPDGSRQFYVGKALTDIGNLEGLDDAHKAEFKQAAIKAFQAVLDHFPESLDYYTDGNGVVQSYRVAPGAYNEIKKLGGKPQGNWIELPGWDGQVTVVPGN